MILFLSFFWIFFYREMMWKDKRKVSRFALKNSIYSYLKLTFLYICMPSIHGSWHRFALLYFEMRSALHLPCREWYSLSFLFFTFQGLKGKDLSKDLSCWEISESWILGLSINFRSIFSIAAWQWHGRPRIFNLPIKKVETWRLKLKIRLFCFKFSLQ